MPSLSFTNGPDSKAVAVVRGGECDGNILYLHMEDKPKPTAYDINYTQYSSMMRHIPKTQRVRLTQRLSEALAKGLTAEQLVGEAPETRALYQRIQADAQKHTAIELPDDGSSFQPVPNPDPKARDVYYIAGISGCGKSWKAREIAENYRKLYPDREVYLVSKFQDDATLNGMKGGPPKYISLDSIIDDPPEISEFTDCLTIFDDYDTLDKKYLIAVQKLIDDIAIRGRHTRSSMCVLSHYLSNFRATRLILAESHWIVLYPLATSFKAMKYVCEHYCGLSKEECQQLKRMGRSVMIHKVYPQFLIAPQKAQMLNTATE
jgi:hypothetical protein